MRTLLILSLVAALTGSAAPRRFASSGHRTHLIELYTSEGCSSCPPAEQWLGALREQAGLWRDFVPVAFHVVYWDRLGWTDRLASKAFTARQYAYASQWSSDTVYTPGFVLDGAEWRSGPDRTVPPPAEEMAGVLSVDYTDNGVCRVRYDRAGDFEVHVALLGSGIISDVRAGENAGRRLHHEFVALALLHAPLLAGLAQVNLPSANREGVARAALAVWVTRRGELTPLQATGGWLN